MGTDGKYLKDLRAEIATKLRTFSSSEGKQWLDQLSEALWMES